MGLSKKSTKKSNQETQSPVIKIFQEMMHLPDTLTNSEKATILREKHEKKKRCGHKSQTDVKSEDTSASERHYNTVQNHSSSRPKSQSVFHGEKRDSWWAWSGETKKDQDDTCSSCVSCALKKIMTQRSGVMSCIAVFLALAGAIAIYCLLCSVPKTEENHVTHQKSNLEKMFSDRPIWDESKSKLMSGLADLYDSEFENNMHMHTGNIQDGSRGIAELSSVLDANKLSEGYGSSRLRNFYKKLIKTDLQIRNLKKSIREARPSVPDNLYRSKRSMNPDHRRVPNSDSDRQVFKDLHVYFPPAPLVTAEQKDIKEEEEEGSKRDTELSGGPDLHKLSERRGSNRLRNYKKLIRTEQIDNLESGTRDKRSFNPFRHPRVLSNLSDSDRQAFKDLHVYFPPAPLLTVHHGHGPKKRFVNDSGPSGFVIENKKLIVKFKHYPKRHKTPYRSHDQMFRMPENRPNPLLENKGLDEVLTRLIEKNVPDSIFDPFALRTMTLLTEKYGDEYFTTDEPLLTNNKAHKNKHKPQSSPILEEVYDKLAVTETPVSSSSIMNAQAKKQLDLIQRVPNIRRLLQVEVEEDSDELVANDEEGVRRRRMGPPESNSQSGSKYHPPALHNPNWKGPMPLYPDEINMVKPAALDDTPKLEVPVNKDVADNKDISDTEYVEDYVNNKFDKLVKMAQAYSDYGVLEDKKEMRNEKSNKNKELEGRVKLSVHKGLGLLERLKKCKFDAALDPEGIRVEYHPKSYQPKDKDKASHTDSHTEAALGKKFNFGSHFKIINQIPEHEDDNHMSLKNFDFLYSHPDKEKSYSLPKDEGPVFSRHKRSLMSVDNINEPIKVDIAHTDSNSLIMTKPTVEKDDIDNKDPVIELNTLRTQTTSFTNEATNKLENTSVNNEAMIENRTVSNINSTNMILGDIFGFIVDWFKVLAGDHEEERDDNDTSIMVDFLTMVNPEKVPIPVEYSLENLTKSTTSKSIFPNYDTEMVHNIRHRSRVLMSVEEKDNATANNDERDKKRSDEVTDDESNATTSTTETNNVSNTTVDSNIDDNDKAMENKTIKKRSASNSNLVFWNDMYDDEYGVKEPLNAIKDKDIKVANVGTPKPANWLGMELKKIANSVRTAKKKKPDLEEKIKRIFRRNTFQDSDKQSFAELTANMKTVCREAAKAVHETRMQAPTRGSKQDDAASSLMQQLVGLMADLVEIQVQQKTCVPLPPDLRTFLVWLTSPNPEEKDPQMQTFDEVVTGPPIDILREATSDVYPADVRTECLGTIHDVEDLIQLYDEMSEEDKSKMSGVREYLENQLDFLHRQLSTFDGGSMAIVIRRRRQSDPRYPHRRLHRFFKNFGKKRTRTTAGVETFTDNKKTSRNVIGFTINIEKSDDIDNDKIKRNLADVYYRALNANSTTVNYTGT